MTFRAAAAPKKAPGSAPSASASVLSVPVPADAPQAGGSGESCTRTADCMLGMKCMGQVCIDPSLGSVGDTCQNSSDCNAHLKCVKGGCADRTTPDAPSTAPSGVSPATSASSAASRPPAIDTTATSSAAEAPIYEPRATDTLPPGLEAFRGLRTTVSLGYGKGPDGGGLGFDWFFAYRFARSVGLSAGVGRISGGSRSVRDFEGQSRSFDVGYVHYLVGLFLGRALHAEVLIGGATANGNVQTTAASLDYSESALALAANVGVDLRLGTLWALTPRAILLYPTDKKVADGVIWSLGLGLTLRVPREGD